MEKKIDHRGRGLRSSVEGRTQMVAVPPRSVTSVASVGFTKPISEDNKESRMK